MQDRTHSLQAASVVSTAPAPTPAQAAPTAQETRGQWLMIAGGVLLGTVGVFVEEARQHPLITVLFRCAFGALALLAWGLATGRMGELRVRGRSWPVVVATGLLMVLNWALFFAAIPLTSIGVATIVFHIQPVWIMLFGTLVLREAVAPRQVAAMLAALLGLVLTTGLLGGDAAAWGPDHVSGLLMCLAGSLCYAAVTILAKTEKVVTPFALAWWQCAVGTVLLLWVPLVHGWPQAPSSWAWLAGLGVLHTGLAYAILFAGMARLTLGRIAVLQYVYPLTAIVLDWAVYGRALDAVQLAGVGLMAGALLVVKARQLR
ncbi:DMT family transporter [Delftia tsuruhatensis]|uniref:DMT family transporter n=1 Tax=Delftia tsuruhatensis TaxID=180282 RepID=UPI0024450448|nr:DMT family transporter [Delftia tsuruhatensis]MDH0777039.1 DMT family transporter [Delftia tsuruhatensis]MDH1460630.1 DMT family transporter [Delftia tsuruhatensis]MDH1826643.1 DMT family transporter [Delftia tsuruhatensis]WGG13795.1 DMT family transporter [Delftia tsuruhatensis]